MGRCPECDAPHHEECWSENSGCATYGCSRMPQTVQAEGTLQPSTYWGQEEKDCPRCGLKIRVAALRCRHCETVFESRAPLTVEQYAAEEISKPRLRTARLVSTLVFLGGVLPFTAPFTLLLGSLWYFSNRATVARLSPTRRVLSVLGLVAALVSTLCLMAAAWMYAVASGVRS